MRSGFLAFFLALALPLFLTAGEDDILGVWLVEEGDAHVEMYRCGDGYCGKIVWLQEELDEFGQVKKDVNNPNAKLQDRTILGLEFATGFKYDGSEYYTDGEIYNSRDGKVYAGYMMIQDDGTLYLKGGYKVFGMTVGKSSTWTRVR